MLISRNLHNKSSEVSIITRSPPASLSVKGQVTKDTTIKRSIGGCNVNLLVGRKPTLGLPAYFVSNVRHVQWAILDTRNESSVFIQVRAFLFLLDKLEGILSDGRHMHEYSYGRSELRCYVQYAQATYKRTDSSW